MAGYALPRMQARVSAEELTAFSRDDHRRLFQALVGAQLTEHRRYVDQAEIDLVRDSVFFRQTALSLTDAETRQLLADVEALVETARQPATGTSALDRRDRLVTLITMPTVMQEAGPRDNLTHHSTDPRSEPAS